MHVHFTSIGIILYYEVFKIFKGLIFQGIFLRILNLNLDLTGTQWREANMGKILFYFLIPIRTDSQQFGSTEGFSGNF